MVFLGVGEGDGEPEADYLIRKISKLRIFDDENGKMNLAVADVQGGILLISQFTLYADTTRGNRPSFVKAAAPDTARRLYEYCAAGLRKSGLTVETGVFGAAMQVSLVNDGPVTVLLDSADASKS